MIDLELASQNADIQMGRFINNALDPLTSRLAAFRERRADSLENLAEQQEAGTASVAQQAAGIGLGVISAAQDLPVIGGLFKFAEGLASLVPQSAGENLAGALGVTVNVNPSSDVEVRVQRDQRTRDALTDAGVGGDPFAGVR